MTYIAGSHSGRIPSKQSGAVLTVLILGLLLVSGGSLLSGYVSHNKNHAVEREISTSLSRAKDALISYAVTYTDNYGHNTRGGVGRLPCPATRPHGSPAMSCGRYATGYLPAVWNRGGKRIDIDHLEYFLRQNLWYSVSPEFRYNPAYNHLNPSVDSDLLEVDGLDDIVAVIVHPGPQTAQQDRASDSADISDFLESENADGDAVFTTGGGVNDRMLTISRRELLPLMERRVLGIVSDWLKEYYEEYGRLPYAARLGDKAAQCVEGLLVGAIAMSRGDCQSPALGEFVSSTVPKGRTVQNTWFGRYGWSEYIYYHVESSCTVPVDTGDCGGDIDTGLTVNGSAVKALLVSVGREITSDYVQAPQNRLLEPEVLRSYLDTAALVEAELSYDLTGIRLTAASNDQALVIR